MKTLSQETQEQVKDSTSNLSNFLEELNNIQGLSTELGLFISILAAKYGHEEFKRGFLEAKEIYN